MSRDPGLEILVEGLTFPEGPRWHDGRLWFSDFYSRRVLAMDERGAVETIIDGKIQPSGLGWTPGGDLLVVSMTDRKLMCLSDGKLDVVAELSSLTGGHCNDMVVDAKGRAYVGNFGFNSEAGAAPVATNVVRVDPNGEISVAASEMFFPNGSVITPDGKTMIIAETYARRLTAFDIKDDGSLDNRRIFAEFEADFPDGICLDEEGAVWVASPRHNRTFRVHEGGRIGRVISTGDRGSFACMLGGENRKTLFICTCSNSGPEEAEKRHGRIEAIEIDVGGAGLP